MNTVPTTVTIADLANLRRVGNTIYIVPVPATSHWANWRDAQAVAHHGEPVASLVKKAHTDADGYPINGVRAGDWVDANYKAYTGDLAAAMRKMKSLGTAS